MVMHEQIGLQKRRSPPPNITYLPVEYPSLKTSMRQAITKHCQEQWTGISQATQLRRIKRLVERWSST